MKISLPSFQKIKEYSKCAKLRYIFDLLIGFSVTLFLRIFQIILACHTKKFSNFFYQKFQSEIPRLGDYFEINENILKNSMRIDFI